MLVKEGDSAVLIDAGVGIRKLTGCLDQLRLNLFDIDAILVTHEHSDHIAGVTRMAKKCGAEIVATAPTLEKIPGAVELPTRAIDPLDEISIGNLSIRPFSISHDAVRPVGYSVRSVFGTVCCATDSGVLTPDIINEASQADLLILESNHDREMLANGPYPYYLKRRIAGDMGHISNDSASTLIIKLAESDLLPTIWLAHLSKTNNTPALALATAQYAAWSSLGTTLDIHVARRDVPSLYWTSRGKPVQFSLAI